jgi:hypothetical protein
MPVRTCAKREMVARVLAGEYGGATARSMGYSPTTVTMARDCWLAATETERAEERRQGRGIRR